MSQYIDDICWVLEWKIDEDEFVRLMIWVCKFKCNYCAIGLFLCQNHWGVFVWGVFVNLSAVIVSMQLLCVGSSCGYQHCDRDQKQLSWHPQSFKGEELQRCNTQLVLLKRLGAHTHSIHAFVILMHLWFFSWMPTSYNKKAFFL